MTVGRETARHSVRHAAGPVHRGAHGIGSRQRGPVSERARIAFFLAALVALALVFVAALVPLRRDRSRLLPPVPAGVSQPPLVPVPAGSPSASPSPPEPSAVVTDPPGFPTSIPTADPVTPSPSRPSPVLRTTGFEAESAVNTLIGDAHIRAAADASGGEVITGIGGAEGSALRFNQIRVPADGVYTMSVYYVSAADGRLAISIDNGAAVWVRFAGTGDGETVGSLTLRVRLQGGANTIQFSNPFDRGPDIDQITVGS
jgi:hypothetical protein